MDNLLQTAPAGLAREKSGYSTFQWDRFIFHTRELAAKLVKQYPKKRWKDLAPDERDAFKKELNACLLKEGIKEVEDGLLRWRMKQVINSLLRKSAIQSEDPRDAAVGPLAPPVDDSRPPGSSNSVATPANTRPFDPIRDI
ncbi:hypothetical protein K458DRAFT_377848 [Lentithecium fluviatile CBS 122367]|uniref:Uncharacterized protein n=1 Tax=Lentithecium fluviatile CBS 122367 TaxID=1168545 RepID=A0A6G1IHM1_9PLEO|nr:hypothetical protein K458DRAFT_377848 [Lentithecium fluviatile CBS 122367]